MLAGCGDSARQPAKTPLHKIYGWASGSVQSDFTNDPPGRWPTFLRLRALEQAASPKDSRTPGTPRRHMEETPASPLTFSTR